MTKQKKVVNDGVSSMQNYESCDITYGPEKDVCKDVTTKSTWSGCVGSREDPLNVSTGTLSVRYPGIMNVSCGRGITPLTDKTATITAEIDAMKASGETYLPSGLLWGLNMLTPGAPASTAAAFDPEDRNVRPHKTLVLMTDGDNTKSPTFPKHDGSNKTLANKYTTDLCNAAKAKKIEIYTVAFQVTDPVTKTLLQSCATGSDHFFNASDSAGLADAFAKIAQSLKQVRLSR